MANDVSNQKQVFFHPVDLPNDMDKFFQSLIQEKIPLQVKPKSLEDASEKPLTILKVYNSIKTILLAKHVSGPKLPYEEVTVVADLKDEKFFCTARVLELKEDGYVLNFEKVFRLQRRNNFRIPIPEKIIKAEVKVEKIDSTAYNNNFRLIDLSAGGFAMSVRPDLIALFEQGAILSVGLLIGNHEQLKLRVKVKYKRKQTPYGVPMYFHCGCEFMEVTSAISQQLAFLVNDCHRQIFARLKS